jgi:DNA-binding transcriptional LysR family regulator
MDIELLRTFLEVSRLRHFGRAGEKLYVTQSAVSARIRQLEATLGVPLFTRNRNDIRLTAEGQRLVKHAETIVSAWVRARQETELGPAYSSALAVGAMWDLWEVLLNRWLPAVRDTFPEIALQIESHAAEVLVRKLIDGLLDLAFVFDPPQLPDLAIREVAILNLIMVSTRPGQTVSAALGADYIMVDWGTSFGSSHAHHFPDLPTPAIRMSLGSLAFNYLLHHDGSAYLAEDALKLPNARQRLFRVEQAPVVKRTAYAVYRPDSERQDIIQTTLALLQQIRSAWA